MLLNYQQVKILGIIGWNKFFYHDFIAFYQVKNSKQFFHYWIINVSYIEH
jgi:hypothetical protein